MFCCCHEVLSERSSSRLRDWNVEGAPVTRRGTAASERSSSRLRDWNNLRDRKPCHAACGQNAHHPDCGIGTASHARCTMPRSHVRTLIIPTEGLERRYEATEKRA